MAASAATLDRSTTRKRPTVGFGATLASEWTKLVSTRSTYLLVGLAIVLSIGLTALASVAIGSTWSGWSASDRESFEPITFSFSGLIVGGILITILGVLVVSSEYSSGMIRQTLTVTPRRGRLLAAKALIISLVSIVVTLIATTGSVLVGQVVFSAFDMPTASVTDWDAIRAIGASSLTSPLFPLIGATFAFIFRSTAAPITFVLLLLFAPSMFGPLFPRWWQENILSLLPGSATDSLAIAHLVDSRMYLDPIPAVAVVIGWLVITIGAAYVTLTRRDA